MNKKILIYDTTLRDGAQAEGISFSAAGKIALARKLDELGFDYIEGGFAGANPKDMEFFRNIRKVKLKHARIAAFGATRRVGLKVTADPFVQYMLDTAAPVVTIVGKSSLFHVHEILRTTPEENFAMIRETVRHMRKNRREVVFDAEHFFDGYKADPVFAIESIRQAAEAGAETVTLCDTNGGCLPTEITAIVAAVVKACPVRIGIHVHNDGEMAVANSLEAVRAGVTHVQGTINGFGERCGNANLCSIVPGLTLKMDRTCLKAGSLARMKELSSFVDDLVNVRTSPRAPYVGDSAFVHKGGQHISAVQKNPKSFEHINPAQVGNNRRMLVSESSGASAVLMKAVEMGVAREKSSAVAKDVLKTLKDLEGRGYAFESADASFRMLIQKVLKEHKSFFELEGFRVIVEKRGKDEKCLSEATIKVRVKGEVEQTVAEGDGPVNALDTALRKALMRFYPAIAKVALTDFRVRILDPEEATAAKTRVVIESSDGEATWGTVGVSENIIEASWEALVDSVEYKLFREEELSKQKKGRSRPRRR